MPRNIIYRCTGNSHTKARGLLEKGFRVALLEREKVRNIIASWMLPEARSVSVSTVRRA